MAADHGGPGKTKPAEEIEQLKKKLSEQTILAEERLERLKYLQAEFDNFRKWSEKEKGSVIARANENLIKDLLVILDDFEQSLPSLEDEKNREGVRMVYQKMVKILSDYGLEPIECIGKKSDPLLHEVICRKQCTDESGTIVEEIGKGYSLKSKVIRPSKVMVAENVSKGKGEKNG
ncbi:nucleotide exchange factor GrpE [Methanogenium sp. S4BF]|uniref:nucleotide exchange factor GrpE n=1 Tax=Methanogenium sp. S4BF TaxID=1789226 RepID=UPI002417865B|nr:nucleotide exchange factor GrpE [Methanogenium sp. S4BF]WFN34513.1 nucleotide exchange factor GrpE [Methanogenium sp. S4BF]